MRCRKRLSSFDKKWKRSNLRNIIIQNTYDFCRNTTLHGLKYVADSKLKIGERAFFAFALTTVVCLAIFLIARVYDKWSNTPVIVGINTEPTFITDDPFPAVSICNLNQALASQVEHFPKNSSEYAMLQLLCNREVNTSIVQTITNWNNLESFILNISQPCNHMLIDCKFGGKRYKCNHIFHPLITDEGLCCVFNMLHPKFMYVSHTPLTLKGHAHHFPPSVPQPVNWNSEIGYPENLPNLYFPHKVPGVGESLALTVTLDVQLDKYYCSSSKSIGFKFALHSPNESPNIRETGIFVENGKETKLRVRPDKIETKKHLKTIKREYRHCLFHHEGKLKFFAHYTQRNCEMECIAEISKRYCDCVSYFMPKMYKNASVCSISDANCSRKVLLRIDKRIKSCLDDCLPSCYGLSFEVDAFSTKLSHIGFDDTDFNLKNMSDAYVEENIAIVHMYFKENSYRSKLQTEFIGLTDFVSSIGGLMGLFLGFSFVSIAELIYFALIRPYQAVRKLKKGQNVYENGDNAAQYLSSIKSKTLCRFMVKRSNDVSPPPPIKIQIEPHHLFQQKMILPYLLNKDFEKSGKDDQHIWLE